MLLYCQKLVEGSMSVINQQFLLAVLQLMKVGLYSIVQITLLSIFLRSSLYRSIRQSLLTVLRTNFFILIKGTSRQNLISQIEVN